jgi:Fe-S oxidoreductase
VLWADTFTTTFDPDILADAQAVLSAAGLSTQITGAGQCCGLTWISTGQLDKAKRVLGRAISGLDARDDSRPIVVVEPSCASALRDDSVALLGTAQARRVAARVVSLAEILRDRDLAALIDTEHPGPAVTAVAQFHCHQRATTGNEADLTLLARLGVAVASVDEGCCGLAGNFGFETGHEEVSRACADQSFRPYLDRDPTGTVLADGFSCRTQITQLGGSELAGRTPEHLASLLARRLRDHPHDAPISP